MKLSYCVVNMAILWLSFLFTFNTIFAPRKNLLVNVFPFYNINNNIVISVKGCYINFVKSNKVILS